MIKLRRKPQGHVSRAHLQAKAQRLQNLLAAGAPVPQALLNAYKDAPVKDALGEESCGKCGYCESKILDTQFGDVEHIRPKQTWPNLRLEYENLLLSCIKCNNAKNVNYDPHAHHVDPYRDEPSNHLLAAGPFVWPRPGDGGLGRVTEFVFSLNRAELVESRQDRLKSIEALAETYAASPNGLAKRLARAALEKEAGGCGEYSMCVLAYLRQVFPDDGF